jgi:hypothetical protein
MSFKVDPDERTTPTSLGGGMILGALFGAIVGGIWGPSVAFSAEYRFGFALILFRLICAVLCLMAGFLVGGLFDWLATRMGNTIQDAAANPPSADKGQMGAMRHKLR